jgi:hypothetical protein
VLIFYGPREHRDFPRMPRRNGKSSLGRYNVGKLAEHSTQSSYFHPQSCTITLIDPFRAECSREENFSWHICRPRFGEQSDEREQDRARGKLDHRAGLMQAKSACVHNEGLRRQ